MPRSELQPLERRVFDYLMAGVTPADSRARVIAERLNEPTAAVHAALRSLELREPALVTSDVDEGLAEQVWFTTPAGRDVD